MIGCGVIANQMAQSLALAGRKLAGVANRTLSKAQAFAEQYGIEKVYESVEDLYADPGIDAVYITTPHNTHITYLRDALAAGKPLPSIPLSSTRRVPSPTSTTSSSWTPPRCFICPCIKSCAVAWMPASLVA